MNLCFFQTHTAAIPASDASHVFIVLDKAVVLAGAPRHSRAPVGETAQEQTSCICKPLPFVLIKVFLPSEETSIPHTCPVPGRAGIAGAPRAVWLGFRAVLRHSCVYSLAVGDPR